jgi:phenylpropionate dioxygenase-like ring-hydroxylating dioxygenase large terminal subunit
MGSVVDHLSDLVDWERGLISAEIFHDADVFELESQRLFLRSWLFLAHESQLKRPGDFFATYMGSDPVLVVRQGDGSIGAFLNACRHRGMRVCRADAGNAKTFTCSYHGWCYDMSGQLVAVPNLEDAYDGSLDMSSWGLVPVARVESYKGLLFGCFDPSAPPLIDHLGDMSWYLDCLVDRREGGVEVVGGVHKMRFKGNWKLAAEQFVGDNYHAGLTHASAFMTWRAEGGDRGMPSPNGEAPAREGRQFSSRLGHGTAGFYLRQRGMASALKARGPDQDTLAQYHADIAEEIEERLGVDRMRGPMSTAALVFPTFSYLSEIFGNSTIGVWHPKGPDAFEFWRIGLVDAAAPPEVKAAVARVMQIWPFGLADADDGENWGGIGANMAGPMVRRQRFNYQMGLGRDRSDDEHFPGRIGPGPIGELPQRGFYRRWLEFLTEPDWPAVTD